MSRWPPGQKLRSPPLPSGMPSGEERLSTPGRPYEARIGERSRGGVGHDHAVGQTDGSVGSTGKIEIVRHQHQSGANLEVEIDHELDDGAAGASIQVAGGLISEQ